MRRVNRECIVCGKHYEYCSGCAGSDPTWKTLYCCEDCREISHILSDYNGGILPLEDANARLNKCELSKIDKLDENSKKIANEILSFQATEEKQDMISDSIKDKVVENVNEEKINTTNNYNQNNRNKKNKNKNNKKRK